MITVLSAGRDSAPELRARLAMDEPQVREILRSSRPGIGELVVLCTCHRTELYVTSDGADSDVVHAVASLLPLRPTDHHELRFLQGLDAVEHLFRVACGLDSLVIGEPQVLGQVRRALVLADEEGAAGPMLQTVFGRALRLGRRARSTTRLGSLGASIGTIASEHLAQWFGGLEGVSGAVVGAGVAASDAAVSLTKAGATLKVVSRTPASARRLAKKVGGEVVRIRDVAAALEDSQFAVVAVSGGILLRGEDLPRRTKARPFVVIDLSVPRSVELGSREDVDVRSLEEIPGPRGPEVSAAVIDAEAMVRHEVLAVARWADTRAVGPAIRDLRSGAETLVREEVARAIGGMDLTPEQAERVAAMAMRIAHKLLHGPTTALRGADPVTRELIERMFGMERDL